MFFWLSSTCLQSLASFGPSVAPRRPPQNGPLTIFDKWSNRYRTGLNPPKPVKMLRKWVDIRNEGIVGVLPTTGSTPSSSARHHARRRGRRAPAPASWRSGPDSSPHTCGDGLVYESFPLEPARPQTPQPCPPVAGPRVQRLPHLLRPWRGAKQSQPSRAAGAGFTRPAARGNPTRPHQRTGARSSKAASSSSLRMLTRGCDTAQLACCCDQSVD